MKPEDKLEAYMDSVAKAMDSRIYETCERIPDAHRRLLALRSYLRHEELINSRWTWSDEEAKAYYATENYKQALREGSRVKKQFEQMMKQEVSNDASLGNHVYSLTFKRTHRDMEEQLNGWNKNDKVNLIALDMWAKALIEIMGSGYNDAPDATSLKKFSAYVKKFKLSKSAPRAAPGLSDHGRFHAFDFKVTRDGKVIADTTTATIKSNWEDPGWRRRLQQAVTTRRPISKDR